MVTGTKLQNRLLSLGRSQLTGAAALGAVSALGMAAGRSSAVGDAARAEAAASGHSEGVAKAGDAWYPNAITKHWHFYRGKMNPASAKSLKLFKCAETPIADEIAGYLGVELNDMAGAAWTE